MPTDTEDVKDQDRIRSLMEALKDLARLQEGELYTLRQGLLQHVRPRDDDALRRVRILEEAYEAAYGLARQLRPALRGYRPDPALVISALVMHAAGQPDAPAIVQQYLQRLFRQDRTRDGSPTGEPDTVTEH